MMRLHAESEDHSPSPDDFEGRYTSPSPNDRTTVRKKERERARKRQRKDLGEGDQQEYVTIASPYGGQAHSQNQASLSQITTPKKLARRESTSNIAPRGQTAARAKPKAAFGLRPDPLTLGHAFKVPKEKRSPSNYGYDNKAGILSEGEEEGEGSDMEMCISDGSEIRESCDKGAGLGESGDEGYDAEESDNLVEEGSKNVKKGTKKSAEEGKGPLTRSQAADAKEG